MGASTENENARIRVLGLGSEILADDAFGILAAREVEHAYPGQVEVRCSSSAGFGLLDDLLGVARLLVVDTVMTGTAEPGTVFVFTSDQVDNTPGGSPHFLGLFEVLDVARLLHLPVPEQTTIIAVEAADCTTVGGPIHPDVESAIPDVVERAGQLLGIGPPGRIARHEHGLPLASQNLLA
ncbi:MAG: hydrogenase maturation protease [Candidatus Solibacter sp.]|nr:hydrogenase maturation protease [Candidatus Solibacter sp.]